MIAIDTNVLVRLLTRDDESQFQKAVSLFGQNDIFIPITVILETEWVLRYAYKLTPTAIQSALVKTFGLENVKIEQPEAVAKAITWAAQGLDFADALHLASSHQCEEFITFDQAFIKQSKRLKGCKVQSPST